MAAADAEAVAVAAGDEDGHGVVGHLDAGGYGERAAVQGMHAVGVDEAGEVGRAADAADGGDIVLGDLQFDEGLLDGGEDAVVAAAGAPVGVDLAFEIGHRDLVSEPVRRVAIVEFLLRVRWKMISSKRLDHDFVDGHGEIGVAGELLFDGFDDVVGHEGFAVVLADVAVGDEAGFAAQIAGELAAEVVLDDDGVLGVLEDVEDGVAMQRDEPADRRWLTVMPCVAQELAGLVDDAVGGAPADEGDVGVGGA